MPSFQVRACSPEHSNATVDHVHTHLLLAPLPFTQSTLLAATVAAASAMSNTTSFDTAAKAYGQTDQQPTKFPKYCFYFSGDGDPTPAGKQQAPKRGCFEVDDGCKNCLESWRKYTPDANYIYEPIRDNEGCNGTVKKGVIPCPPGLFFYQWF